MTFDANVEMVRKAGERLLARYGGLEGLVHHLQAMDRQRRRRKTQPAPQKPSAKIRHLIRQLNRQPATRFPKA